MPRPRVLVLPGPSLYRQLFAPDIDAGLRELASLTFNDRDENWTPERLAAEIAPYHGLVTCWGSPPVTDAVLDAAPNLRIVAHAAGSVKAYIPENVLKRGILVSSAAIAMSPAVAEFSLILCLLGLRAIHLHDRAMRQDRAWPEKDAFGTGSELASQRVGVIGCGMIGRIFVGMLRGFGVTPKVYDPYLSDDDAATLGVVKAELADLMAGSDLVVNHAPTTPETRHLIGAAALAAMPDGALLVNTARSWVIDQEALLAELRTGRIRAALDVYDREPLPADHPFRDLPNVILTPHIAGWTRETRYRQGASVLRNLTDAFAGQPLSHPVTLERYHLLA